MQTHFLVRFQPSQGPPVKPSKFEVLKGSMTLEVFHTGIPATAAFLVKVSKRSFDIRVGMLNLPQVTSI